MADAIEITIGSHPRWLRLIRQTVLEYAREAGFNSHDGHAITLAVGEAVGNVIKHAYQGRTDQTFQLSCRTRDGFLEVEVRDHGGPFDPKETPELAPDELRPGGRGLYLIKTIMDEIEYGRDGEENVVSMRKRLAAPSAG
jgi:serine/threonine-protein kinase RsbW